MKFKLFVFETEDRGDYDCQRVVLTLLQQHPEGVVWDEIPDSERKSLQLGIIAYNQRAYPFKRNIVCVEYPVEGLLPEVIQSGKDLIAKQEKAEKARIKAQEERRKTKEVLTRAQKIKQLAKLKVELGEK